MLKKLLSLICAVAMMASFATFNIAHADDAMVTTSIKVEESGVLGSIAATLGSGFAKYQTKAGYPLYKVTVTLSGFQELVQDSSFMFVGGLKADGGNIVVKFDDELFEYIIVSDFTNLSQGVTDHAELSILKTEKEVLNGDYVMYFIPTTNAKVTEEAVFAITSEAANAAGARTSFSVDYYGSEPSWTPVMQDAVISTADGKVSTSSFTLNKKEEPEVETLAEEATKNEVDADTENRGYKATIAVDPTYTGVKFDITAEEIGVAKPGTENLLKFTWAELTGTTIEAIDNFTLGLNIKNVPKTEILTVTAQMYK